MKAEEWITVFLIGILAGSAGQLVRAVSGLAKRNQQGEDAPPFQGTSLVVSILVGAVAGFIAALSLRDKIVPEASTEIIFGLMAAGYAGADFIEGFAGKLMPGAAASKLLVPHSGQPAAPPAPAPTPAVNVNVSSSPAAGEPPSATPPPASPPITPAVG